MIPAPPPSAIRDNSGQAVGALRRRCASLGLPTWCCDNAGLILAEPEDTGPVGLLWSSSAFTQLIAGAARVKSGGVAPAFPGAWTIGLSEERRRSRTGSVVALALSPEALESDFFVRACTDAALDAHAVRRLLLPRARYTAESGASLRDAMLWMAQDLAHVEESDHTSAAFTRQLSDAFETIDLLYSLGRSMNDLAQPEQFVSTLAARVRATLSFGWVAGWFAPTDMVESDGLCGRTILSGQTALAATFDDVLPAELARMAGEPRATVLDSLNGAPIPGSGQVLALPVMRSGKPAGFMLAGDKFGSDPQVSSYDIQLLEAAAGYVGAFMENAGLYARQRALSLGVLESLTAAIDAKDTYTCGHSQRVAHLSQQLALASGMGVEQAERVRIAGLVHDVGKIGVPEAVLCKSGKLTEEEFDAIKKHPEMGYKILKDLPLLEDILPGVLYHHERWDGRGYPHGIAGEAIPPIARIIALADTFDAMSSNRSYRSAMARERVLAEIVKCAGSQFDPALAALFVKIDLREFDRMVAVHAAQQAASAPAAPAMRMAA